MNLNFLCCIGAEQKHDQSGMLKMNQVYFYRAYADETMSEILKDNFFNHSESHLKENDIILAYSPNEKDLPKVRWLRIVIPHAGLVKTEKVDNSYLLEVLRKDLADLGDQVAGIEEKIPGTASPQNQLATNSQITDLQNTKATKATDFQTPITSTNKGATMKEIEEVITSSLVFKGYISTTEPEGGLVEGNLWINSSSLPTTFPVPAADIKQWNGSAWVTATESYTPIAFDSFRNNNDNEGYYWFGGEWVVLSTDLSTEYFVLNQTSGKWEIKSNVNLPGTPTVATPTENDTNAIANVEFIKSIVVPGIVAPFAGTTPPAGWLKCDGSAVSRERYAELFAAIGTTYGTGDGSTTFNLPTQSVLPLGTSAKVAVYGTSKSIQVNDGSNNASLSAGLTIGSGGNVGVGTKVSNLDKGNSSGGFAQLSANTTIGLKTSTTYGASGIVGTADIANATGAKAIVCIKY